MYCKHGIRKKNNIETHLGIVLLLHNSAYKQKKDGRVIQFVLPWIYLLVL